MIHIISLKILMDILITTIVQIIQILHHKIFKIMVNPQLLIGVLKKLKLYLKKFQFNDLLDSYLYKYSIQGFQNNQNLNSLPNSNDFDYNPCQFNFELQSEFQNQNENVNHFSNNFGNGNNFNFGAIDNFFS